MSRSIDQPVQESEFESKKSKKKSKAKTKHLPSAPVEAQDARTDSKKRKRESVPEEIEVDVTLPEPLSKKAARKAKKQKTQPSTDTPVDGAGNPAAESKATPGQDETEQKPAKRSDYGVWIGNLPWSATKDTLRTFITTNSDIEANQITRVHLPPPTKPSNPNWTTKPLNKGFAYVDFSTELAMYSAIALTETKMDGRPLLIKNAKNFEGRPKQAKEEAIDGTDGKDSKPPNKRIFVGNLGFDTTKDELIAHFGQCGDIEDVHMATFEDSGKCKGFAWVTFGDVEAATAAVKGYIYMEKTKADSDDEGQKKNKFKNRKVYVNRLMGRELRCEFAEDATVRYNKRFGKEKKTDVEGVHPDRQRHFDDEPQSRSKREFPGGNEFQNGAHGKWDRRGKVDPRTIKSGAAHTNAPRASQAIVASQGKKITFD
ncbi:hypothetical protein EJ04DRAFT_515785 [Polyplosphaeria fusca]|uniref:RRM domain-containing protein n=1 Tax=Polyplosphaeria fusca TaxID=682080 RepID=A0A9P4QLP4_9PLEO|nr:hypothetical protein EJ04DRAFT_515785 [Polyplosphaeria fusca]